MRLLVWEFLVRVGAGFVVNEFFDAHFDPVHFEEEHGVHARDPCERYEEGGLNVVKALREDDELVEGVPARVLVSGAVVEHAAEVCG